MEALTIEREPGVAAVEPLYRQIADRVREQILAGEYEPGAKLPSERVLADQFSVQRDTVRRAMALLVAEGLVSSYQGKGYLVREQTPFRYQASVSENSDRRAAATADIWITDAQARGHKAGVRLSVSIESPPRIVAELLQLADRDPGGQVAARRRVRLLDDAPYALSIAYWPLWLIRDTPIEQPHDMQPGPLRWLADHRGIHQRSYRDLIRIRMPSVDESKTLGLSLGTPVAEHIRTSYDDAGTPLRCTVTVLPGDRFEIEYEGDM